MEGFKYVSGSESDTDDDASQEKSLNLSASQLVQIMNCAMKRRNGRAPQLNSKRQKCVEGDRFVESSSNIQSCSSQTIFTHKSNQELIQRNKYLERRVNELEKLNHSLQFGLLQAIQGTIIDTLKTIIPSHQQQQETEETSSLKESRNYSRSHQTIPPRSLPTWSVNHNDMIKNNVTSSSKSPDVFTSVENGRPSSRRDSIQSSVASEECEVALCEQVEQQLVQIKNEKDAGILKSPLAGLPYETNLEYQEALTHSNFQARREDGCQNELVTSSEPTIKVLGMANEIQQVVNESTNYKKLTNKLLNILFNREELACSTLTGKSKGEYAKEKLDEDTVNLIIQQALMRFPGTSASDVRVVISQNCKDKALRFHKSNKLFNNTSSNPSSGQQ